MRLGDVADVRWGDTSTTKAAYVDEGYVAYSAKGPDGYLPYSDYDRVAVVVSAIGADCGKTWLAQGKWSCIKNTIRFWSTDPNVDTEYLYWTTRNPLIWPKRGSAQPFIAQTDARNIEIAFPPLQEQRRIAHILGTLDDKIELNRRMNETLEEMARAIFKDWFVDFGPVRAKMEGRDAYLPDEIWRLFPDRLEESELGEVPEGWVVVPLEDVLLAVNNRVGDADPPEYSCTNTGLHPRADRFKKRLSTSKSKNKLIQGGDLVFGLSRQILNFGLMREDGWLR